MVWLSSIIKFLRVHSPLKLHMLFYCTGLAIQHGLQSTGHMKVNNGREATILNLIESIFFRLHLPVEPHILLQWSSYFDFDQVDFLRVYLPLKPQNLFKSYGLDIEHGLQNIGHMEVNNGR